MSNARQRTEMPQYWILFRKVSPVVLGDLPSSILVNTNDTSFSAWRDVHVSTILIGIHLKDNEVHASYFENINFKYLLMFIPENQQVKTDTKYQDGGHWLFLLLCCPPIPGPPGIPWARRARPTPQGSCSQVSISQAAGSTAHGHCHVLTGHSPGAQSSIYHFLKSDYRKN